MDEDEVSEIALVEEFLQHALMKETADYARRGRQYASALVSDINDQWTECGFRRLRPGIPIERGHAFRSKAATCSDEGGRGVVAGMVS